MLFSSIRKEDGNKTNVGFLKLSTTVTNLSGRGWLARSVLRAVRDNTSILSPAIICNQRFNMCNNTQLLTKKEKR